jgi:hypothetical protein
VQGGSGSSWGPGAVPLAVRVSRRTVDELGRDGIAELAEHLWAGNCQTCGTPLGAERPALLVDDLMVSALASLHHPHCLRPEWNDGGGIRMTSSELVTHLTRALMVPLPFGGTGRPAEQRPALLVNPGLEMVMLRRGADRRWRVATVDLHTHHGLHPADARLHHLSPDRPVAGVRARLTGAGLRVELPHATWTAAVEPAFGAEVRRSAGFLLAVTTMLRPDGHAPLQSLVAAVRAGQVATGWVATAS